MLKTYSSEETAQLSKQQEIFSMASYAVSTNERSRGRQINVKRDYGAGKMAPWVERLQYKHEDLSSDSRHPHKSRAQLHTSVISVLEEQRQEDLGKPPARLCKPTLQVQ